jgi:2-hydroxychromene-2-carboxylate isomerase
MLTRESSRMDRQKVVLHRAGATSSKDPQRVLDFARSGHIQQFWDSETDRARELGVFGSPTFVAIGNWQRASFGKGTEP